MGDSMLVLTRRIGEEVVIAGNIRVIFLGYGRKDQVKLGFIAPDEVDIFRAEIQVRINAEAGRG